MSDRILLIGATGLVGSAFARQWPEELTVLARRAVDFGPNVTAMIIPAAQWAEAIADIKPAILINTLGTTIKQAGSKDAFSAVDHDLVLVCSHAAKAAGVRQIISVSSVGASAKSGNFYLSVKGKVEQELRGLGVQRLDILRPGLLLGDRQGPRRRGESIGMMLAPFTDALMMGSLRRYRSIHADAMGRAIAALVKTGGSGTHIHENESLMHLDS